ncbi:MAG: hypothetical protein J6M53_03065 [Bacteroidaceae bacterium]|nr:hypothetical protein [Bacteroidaceae bacterium]
MKKTLSILAASALLLSSCGVGEYYGVATGSSLGGMFGSAIGGLMGGPRGSDTGAIVGMVAGGVLGAAATSERSTSSTQSERYSHNDVVYDYTPQRNYVASSYGNLTVRNVTFNDENGNHCLDSRERAYIILDIYNEGRSDAYDVAPVISCDNKRIVISPTAIISRLPSGRGARYKAAVATRGNLKNGQARFTVTFDNGRTLAKSFTIQTRR